MQKLLAKLKLTGNFSLWGSFVSSLGARGVVLILNLVTTIVTARILGPQGRGEYYFVIIFSTMVSQFANLGLSTSNTYFLVADRSKLSMLIANSFWVSAIVGLVSAAIAIICWIFFHRADTQIEQLMTALLLAPAMLFYLLLVNLLIGLENIKAYNYYQLICNIIVATMVLVSALLWKSVMAVLLITALGWILACILVLGGFKEIKLRESWKINLKAFRTGFSYSLKAYLLMLLGMLVMRANVLFLENHSGSAVVGYYSLAAQISDALLVIPVTLATVLFPRLIKDKEGKWETTKKNLLLIAVVMGITCLFVMLITKTFVLLAFGENFLAAVPILYYMLPGVFFYSLLSIVSQYLSAKGIPWLQIINWFLAVIVLFLANYYVVPKNAVGAAMAFSITYLFLFVSMWIIIKLDKDISI